MPRKRNFDINKAHSFMLTIVLFSYNMEDIGEHDSNFPKYPDFERIKKHVLLVSLKIRETAKTITSFM